MIRGLFGILIAIVASILISFLISEVFALEAIWMWVIYAILVAILLTPSQRLSERLIKNRKTS